MKTPYLPMTPQMGGYPPFMKEIIHRLSDQHYQDEALNATESQNCTMRLFGRSLMKNVINYLATLNCASIGKAG